jgi:hypothetical protein
VVNTPADFANLAIAVGAYVVAAEISEAAVIAAIVTSKPAVTRPDGHIDARLAVIASAVSRAAIVAAAAIDGAAVICGACAIAWRAVIVVGMTCAVACTIARAVGCAVIIITTVIISAAIASIARAIACDSKTSRSAEYRAKD